MHYLSLVAQTLLITAAVANPLHLDKRAPTVSKTTSTSCSYVSATPSPASLICGQEGSIKKVGNSFLTWNAGSQTNACLDYCKHDPECISYSFDSGAEKCMYYNATIKSGNFQTGDTGSYFWNHRCFVDKCTTKTLTVTSTTSKSTAKATSTEHKESTHSTEKSTSKTTAKASPIKTSIKTSSTLTKVTTKASPTKTSTKISTTTTTKTVSPKPTPTKASSTKTSTIPSSTSNPDPPSTCTAPPSTITGCPDFKVSVPDTLDVVDYSLYFKGFGVTEDPNNPGNPNFLTLPPQTVEFPGNLTLCDAAQDCAERGTLLGVKKIYFSFDLHFLQDDCLWECVLYSGANTNATYFDVHNSTVGAVVGYSGALAVGA